MKNLIDQDWQALSDESSVTKPIRKKQNRDVKNIKTRKKDKRIKKEEI